MQFSVASRFASFGALAECHQLILVCIAILFGAVSSPFSVIDGVDLLFSFVAILSTCLTFDLVESKLFKSVL